MKEMLLSKGKDVYTGVGQRQHNLKQGYEGE